MDCLDQDDDDDDEVDRDSESSEENSDDALGQSPATPPRVPDVGEGSSSSSSSPSSSHSPTRPHSPSPSHSPDHFSFPTPSPSHSPSPSPGPAPGPAPSPQAVEEEATLVPAKARLLAKSGFQDSCGQVRVTVDGTRGLLQFRGEATAVQEARLQMYVRVNDFVLQEAELPLAVKELLTQQGGQLLARLASLVESRDTELFQEGGRLQVAAVSQHALDAVLDLLRQAVVSAKVPYNDSHSHYLGGLGWARLREELEDGGVVAVTQGRDVITLEGLGQEVAGARVRLERALQENGLRQVTESVRGLRVQALQRFHQPLLQELQSSVRSSQGQWREKAEGQEQWQVTVECRPDVADAVKARLSQAVSQLWQDSLLLSKVFGQDNAELLLRGLQHCPDFLKDAEQRFQCVLRVPALTRLPDVSKPAQPQPQEGVLKKIGRWMTGAPKREKVHDVAPPVAVQPSVPLLSSATMGTTKVSVKQGDITKEKADVLVNVVPPNKNLNVTAVSKAFLAAGGAAFQQAFQAATGQLAIEQVGAAPTGSDVIVTRTNGFGTLACKFVFHLPLQKWQQGGDKLLQQLVEKSLTLAVSHGASSMAFPSLGHGQLFHYPPLSVATTCLAQLQRSLTGPLQGKLSSVAFVIYDQAVHQEFLKELTRTQSPGPPSTLTPAPVPKARATQVLKKRATLTADEFVQLANKGAGGAVPGLGEARLEVAARCQEEGLRAVEGLTATLKREFLYEGGPVSLDMETTEECQQAIRTIAQGLPVSLRFQQQGGEQVEVMLRGQRDSVHNVQAAIMKFCMEELKKEKAEKEQMPPRSRLVEFAQWMFRHDADTALAYWTHFTPDKPLKQHVLEAGEDSARLVPVDAATRQAVEKLVQSTWQAHLVGHGRDAVGLGHSRLQVTKVERLENPLLLQRYLERRAVFFQRVCLRGGAFTPLSQIPDAAGDLMTRQHADPALLRELYEEVNEHYFFHGTRPEIAASIQHTGLDNRLNTNGMFGPGTYLAESSSKADQYADIKNQRTPGEKKMLLVRAMLGDPYVCCTPNPTKFKKPPCRVQGCNQDTCEHQKNSHDSVIGSKVWNFREFVVYEREMSYPEYFITYTRV